MITKESIIALLREPAESSLAASEINAIHEAFNDSPGASLLGTLFPAGAFSLGIELGRIMMGRELGLGVLNDAQVGVDTPWSGSGSTE